MLSFTGYGNLFNYPMTGDSDDMVLSVVDVQSVLLEIREGPNMPDSGKLTWTSDDGKVTGDHTFNGISKETQYKIDLPVTALKLKFKITDFKPGKDGGAAFGNTTPTPRYIAKKLWNLVFDFLKLTDDQRANIMRNIGYAAGGKDYESFFAFADSSGKMDDLTAMVAMELQKTVQVQAQQTDVLSKLRAILTQGD